MSVLTGDIGGTNARLTIFSVEDGRYEEMISEVYPSPEYTSLEEIVAEFMGSHSIEVRSACFGVPGPVKDGRAQITNLSWVVEASKLAARSGVERIAVLAGPPDPLDELVPVESHTQRHVRSDILPDGVYALQQKPHAVFQASTVFIGSLVSIRGHKR